MISNGKKIGIAVICLILVSTIFFFAIGESTPVQLKKPKLELTAASLEAKGDAGMVVTAHPLASKVGADILKQGGNAIDAAIATHFALNVTEPMMSGIGGGGFMVIYHAKTKKVTIINSRERAPLSAHPNLFLDENGKEIPFEIRSTNGKAVGVPGTVHGLYKAHQLFGTRSMSQLIQPAVDLAEKGIPVNRILARAIDNNRDKLSRSAAKELFLPHGKPLKEGDRLVQKDLAKTFRIIQEKGIDGFYDGVVAKALVDVVNQKGGKMTLEDLKRYQVTLDQPLEIDYRGYQIVTTPPPSSAGVIVAQILKLLDAVQVQNQSVRTADLYHLFVEVSHLAYADRAAFLGDPEFGPIPLKGLLHPDYIQERAKLVQSERANPAVPPGNPWKYEGRKPVKQGKMQKEYPPGQTTHYTIADQWGNIVSYTTTIEQEFGTGIMVPGYGFFLNNELTDFDAIPGGPNEVEPGKRPRSSMGPTIIFYKGKPIMTVGSPGGTTIISSIFQVIYYRLVMGMELKAAVEEPRIYSIQYPFIRWEKGVPSEAREELKRRGHQFEAVPREIGNANTMWINLDTNEFHGVGDSSRESTAIGLRFVDQ